MVCINLLAQRIFNQSKHKLKLLKRGLACLNLLCANKHFNAECQLKSNKWYSEPILKVLGVNLLN